MSIIRAPRPQSRFYHLDKSISEDERLSWEARGVLIFLLGKPDHWEVSVKHLMGQTKNAIGRTSGRDAIRRILRELEEAGYLVADRARQQGVFSGMEYIVSETPCTDFQALAPRPGNPAPDLPAPEKPAPENPHLIKNKDKQNTEKASKTEVRHCTPTAKAEDGAGGVVVSDEQPRCVIPEDMPGPKDQSCKTFKSWANYAMAYRKRYEAWPVWNQKVAGQFGQLVKRLGADVAHHVSAFFVTIDDARLINGCHSVGDLLYRCEAYCTQWQTNRRMNATTARQAERKQSNLSAGQEAARRILEKAQGGQHAGA